MKTIKTILLLIALIATQPARAMDLPNSNDLGMLLIKAIARNDTQRVNDLVTRGANVNSQVHDTSFTALMYAVGCGNQDIVKKLIDAQADLNQKDKDDDTALMCATRGHHHTNIVKMLIDAKADISCKNNQGNSALLIAASNEHKEMVEMLIIAGAELNLRNYANLTALTIAAMKSNHPICNSLIEANFKRSQEKKERACAFLFCLKYLSCGQPKGQNNTHYSNLKNVFKETLISNIQEPLINVLAQIHEVRNPRMKQALLKKYETTLTLI